ncbi:MAG TPA: hypothetical protein VEV83_20140 [Parafilimonas sp.]|nr:hypothetical protein [Parafilimonas sp.]
MKTVLLSTILSVVISFGAFANDDSIDAHLAKTLPLIFKMTDETYLLNANAYYQTTVFFKGVPVTAFKSNTSNWVGFFENLSAADLPQNSQLTIARNFHGCKIQQVRMYIGIDGEIDYFAELARDKKSFILKIDVNGNVKRFSCNTTHVVS